MVSFAFASTSSAQFNPPFCAEFRGGDARESLAGVIAPDGALLDWFEVAFDLRPFAA
jgi:hypothetical protein